MPARHNQKTKDRLLERKIELEAVKEAKKAEFEAAKKDLLTNLEEREVENREKRAGRRRDMSLRRVEKV